MTRRATFEVALRVTALAQPSSHRAAVCWSLLLGQALGASTGGREIFGTSDMFLEEQRETHTRLRIPNRLSRPNMCSGTLTF
jgi:hypothetical protein